MFLLCFVIDAYAGCEIQNNEFNKDLLTEIFTISEICPANVIELKKMFTQDNLYFESAIVANRGFHNPSLGSFSIFESLRGDSKQTKMLIRPEHLYFGHFTYKTKFNFIELDQENRAGKLIIELMAFDFNKKVYNFYELIGGEVNPTWIYRGDSYDAIKDNENLKINKRPKTKSKMRCSACHNDGGPIMKELDHPYSDWWTEKNLIKFGDADPSDNLRKYMNSFLDASIFSANIKMGIDLLEKNINKKSLSIKEKLRPLFCTTQINLKSDVLMVHSTELTMVLSTEVFINPILVKPFKLFLNKNQYLSSLIRFKSTFPETKNIDSQYGFHAPVKGFSNIKKVNQLITDGFIYEEFAIDVLSIDRTNPLFSKKRCELLKLIPEKPNWLSGFIDNLSKADSITAKLLLKNLMIKNKNELILGALKYLESKESYWKKQSNVDLEVLRLNSLRLSVFKNEISQNPLGQILEPGFRVVFPNLNL